MASICFCAAVSLPASTARLNSSIIGLQSALLAGLAKHGASAAASSKAGNFCQAISISDRTLEKGLSSKTIGGKRNRPQPANVLALDALCLLSGVAAFRFLRRR